MTSPLGSVLPLILHLRFHSVPFILYRHHSGSLVKDPDILMNNGSTGAPPTTPNTNHQHKQLQEKTLTTVQVVCGHAIILLLAPPSFPASNPPTSAFYDRLFEPEPNETVHVPQPEQGEGPKPPELEGCSPICSKLFARLQNTWG